MVIAVIDPYSLPDPTWLNTINAPVVTFLVQDEPESDVGRLHVALILDVTNLDIKVIADKMLTGWFMLTWSDEGVETVWFNDASFSGSEHDLATKHATEHHGIIGSSYLDFSEFFRTYRDRMAQVNAF